MLDKVVEEKLNDTLHVKTEKEEKTKKNKLNKEKIIEEINKQNLNDFINDDIKLLYGDCLKRMKEITDNSIDLILCDLPYGTTKCKWDTIIDIDKLWNEYKRIIKKPSGVILLFGQQPFTSRLISSNYEWFKYNIIWKNHSNPPI